MLLLIILKPVLQDGAFEQAAMKIVAQYRMMHRHQLRRDHPAEVRSALDVVGFRDAALECPAPERARILLEAPDHPREFAELLVAREAASEFEALARRQPPTLAELAAEGVTVLGRL